MASSTPFLILTADNITFIFKDNVQPPHCRSRRERRHVRPYGTPTCRVHTPIRAARVCAVPSTTDVASALPLRRRVTSAHRLDHGLLPLPYVLTASPVPTAYHHPRPAPPGNGRALHLVGHQPASSSPVQENIHGLFPGSYHPPRFHHPKPRPQIPSSWRLQGLCSTSQGHRFITAGHRISRPHIDWFWSQCTAL